MAQTSWCQNTHVFVHAYVNFMCEAGREKGREREIKGDGDKRVGGETEGASKFSSHSFSFTFRAHFELMTKPLSPDITFASEVYKIVKLSSVN